MRLAWVLSKRHPTARHGVDYLTERSGGVSQITKWDERALGPKPTMAELEQLNADMVAQEGTEEVDKSTVIAQILALLAKPEADVTNAEIKWLVLKMAKYIVRKGL